MDLNSDILLGHNQGGSSWQTVPINETLSLVYLRLHTLSWEPIQTALHPSLQALSKVAYCLSQGSRNWTKHTWYKKLHNALVENVVTRCEVLHESLAVGEEKELLTR